MQDGQLFFHQTIASNSSVKSESQLYFANDCFNSESTQYSEGYEPDLCMPDYNNSNPSCNMQRIGYHNMDNLQSVAFAYLNEAWQADAFGSYCTSSNSFDSNILQMSIKFSSMALSYWSKMCDDIVMKYLKCQAVLL